MKHNKQQHSASLQHEHKQSLTLMIWRSDEGHTNAFSGTTFAVDADSCRWMLYTVPRCNRNLHLSPLNWSLCGIAPGWLRTSAWNPCLPFWLVATPTAITCTIHLGLELKFHQAASGYNAPNCQVNIQWPRRAVPAFNKHNTGSPIACNTRSI